MARKQIKLTDTGEVVDRNSALYFYAPNKKWYSSYDAYLIYDIENQYRDQCIARMYSIMGYGEKQKISTLFYKRLKEWHEGYEYKTILRAMELSVDSIEYSFRVKDFDNENSKLFYALAIINNKLNDALKLSAMERKVNKAEKNTDLDMFVDGIETMQNICGNTKSRDVSNLAGDL